MAVGGKDGQTNRLTTTPPPPMVVYPESRPCAPGEDEGVPTDGNVSGEPAEALAFHLVPGEGLLPRRPGWQRPGRLLFAVLTVTLFLLPEMIDGMWWLTLAVSEAVAGLLIIFASVTHRRLATVAVIVLAVLGFVGLEAYNDAAFGTLSLSGPPPLIFACGAEYTRASSSPVAVGPTLVLHGVGTTPSGMALLGNTRCGTTGSVWAFVSTAPGRVIPYLIDHYAGQRLPYWR